MLCGNITHVNEKNVMIFLYTDISVAVIVIMDIDIAVGEGIPSYIDLFFLKPHTAAFIYSFLLYLILPY